MEEKKKIILNIAPKKIYISKQKEEISEDGKFKTYYYNTVSGRVAVVKRKTSELSSGRPKSRNVYKTAIKDAVYKLPKQVIIDFVENDLNIQVDIKTKEALRLYLVKYLEDKDEDKIKYVVNKLNELIN